MDDKTQEFVLTEDIPNRSSINANTSGTERAWLEMGDHLRARKGKKPLAFLVPLADLGFYLSALLRFQMVGSTEVVVMTGHEVEQFVSLWAAEPGVIDPRKRYVRFPAWPDDARGQVFMSGDSLKHLFERQLPEPMAWRGASGRYATPKEQAALNDLLLHIYAAEVIGCGDAMAGGLKRVGVPLSTVLLFPEFIPDHNDHRVLGIPYWTSTSPRPGVRGIWTLEGALALCERPYETPKAQEA